MDISVLGSFLGDNAFQVDAAEAEAKLREKYPLLLHSDERIELAFKGRGGVGRDKSYLTSHRILIKDGKGIGSKRRNYLSVPYKSIKAFSVQTAGKFLDGDVELKVWAADFTDLSIDFAKGQVDIFAIQQFINVKMDWAHEQGTEDFVEGTPPPSLHKQSALGDIIDWFGDNARQMYTAEVEQRLKNENPVLLQDEKVEMAFKAGRDSTVFTDKRLLIIDVKGTGKQVEFQSFAWRCISGFSVETAGAYFDRDTDMKIYTNIPSEAVVRQDFRRTRADVMAVQKFLSNRVLGEDKLATPDVDRRQGHVDPKSSWWFRDNQRPLDAVEMDRYYHTEVPILQSSEHVELAFKGRRDITLFTTKRLIDIDPKGWTGVKIEYTSVPWKRVLAFGVKTAGKHMDTDAEVRIWTDMMFIPGSGEDNPPEPGMSFMELDFNKNMVNIMNLKKYLSLRLLSETPNIPISPNAIMTSPEEHGFEKFLSKIGDDQRAIDPNELNQELHTTNPILLDGEKIVMAFKAGRDVTLFTNLRVMELDVQGWSGKKIAYTSIPYTSVRAFSAESAGGWDRDSEVDLYTRNLWDLKKFGMDFRKGKADIIAIQKFLAAIVLGNERDAAQYFNATSSPIATTNPAGLGSFLAWLTDNSEEEDPSVVDAQLHSDPPILLSDERVERTYRQGRDMYVYTSHRILIVDVQGIRGKKVEYKSVPLRWCTAFEVETAGHLDRDAEVYVHTAVSGIQKVKQSILVKNSDILEMHKYWTERMLFRNSAFE